MDDPTPNTSWHPVVPLEDKEAIEIEKQRAAQSLPFLDGVTEWFEEQIKLADSIEFCLAKAIEYEQPTEEMLIALNILKNLFESKKGEFESLKLTFKK
jgi:hypothetical protein